MIFKQCEQVLDGTKTQTRRPVKEREQLISGDVGRPIWVHAGGHSAATCKVIGPGARFVTGKTYAIQPGRGKKAVGRIRITKIRRQELQGIMPLDIMAEGIEPIRVTPNRFMAEVRLEDFAQLWDSIYRKPYRWEDNPDVWVLEFEKGPGRQ